MATAFAVLRPSALRSLRLLRFSTSARKSKPRHLTPDVKLPARHPNVTRTHPEGTDPPLDADEAKPKRSQLALDGLFCPSLPDGNMARIALHRRCRDLAARSSRQELDRPELLRAGRARPVARNLARALTPWMTCLLELAILLIPRGMCAHAGDHNGDRIRRRVWAQGSGIPPPPSPPPSPSPSPLSRRTHARTHARTHRHTNGHPPNTHRHSRARTRARAHTNLL